MVMKWQDLLNLLGGVTLFESSMLLAAEDSPAEVRRQISRWLASGRLIQLRRGLYALALPHARELPGTFAVASRLRRPSYVSLESGLAYHGVIPEAVPVVTSVTTGRPGRFKTPVGGFVYRHIHPSLFWGYQKVELGSGQSSYIAFPEKALLDMFHFTSGNIRRSFVDELRLAPGQLNPGRLQQFAKRAAKPKLIRAASLTVRFLGDEMGREAMF
jgi:predicted transcriptional regulator of viral defense system